MSTLQGEVGLEMTYVKNKPSAPGRVWIGGTTAKELKALKIPYVSKQDWGNWMFSIERINLPKIKKL